MTDDKIRHLEPFIDACVATLRANLAAEVDAVNDHHNADGHSITLDHVPTDRIFFGGFTELNYPLIEVASPDFAYRNWSLAQLIADQSFSIVIRLLVLDADPEKLYRRNLRYGSAIIAALVEPDAFGAGTTIDPDIGVRGSYRHDPEADTREELTGSTLLVFALQQVESRV